MERRAGLPRQSQSGYENVGYPSTGGAVGVLSSVLHYYCGSLTVRWLF